MRLLVCALSISVALSAPIALAAANPPPDGADVAAIESCIAAAGDRPEACIGKVARACLGGDLPPSAHSGPAACADRERSVWTLKIDRESAAIRASLAREPRLLFDDAALAWSKYVATSCAFDAALYEGGGGAAVAEAECLLRASAERALTLVDSMPSPATTDPAR